MNIVAPHKEYNSDICNLSHPRKWMDRLTQRKREEMYDIMQSAIPLERMEKILDVGVTAHRGWASANYLENLFPHIDRIVGLSTENLTSLSQHYGISCVQGDGTCLPFIDNSFDLVFSSAVIEHVGNYSLQCRFIQEAYRVCRHYTVFTTPNRWHPIELHTHLPLLHWLPKSLHRKLLKAMGFDLQAQEKHLNLLCKADIREICRALGIAAFRCYPVYWLGNVSNWVTVLTKIQPEP